MNGRDLALGLVGALALAGAVRRRGSASLEAWPNADALARTLKERARPTSGRGSPARCSRSRTARACSSSSSRPTGGSPTGTSNVLPKAERHAALREAAAYVQRGGHLVLAVRPQASWKEFRPRRVQARRGQLRSCGVHRK